MACTVYGQISLVPNPVSSDLGISSSTILFKDKICFIYYGDPATPKAQLAQFDGISITKIPNPTSDGELYGFLTVLGDKLCFAYRSGSGKNQVAYFDGTSITLVNNPGADDAGFATYPIVYNNDLYFQYTVSGSAYQLAKFDGTTVTLINNPTGSSPFDVGFNGYPIVYNNKLYFQYTETVFSGLDPTYKFRLAQYDGTAMTLITNPNATVQTENTSFSFPAVYAGTLCFPYLTSGGNYQLATFDGTTISLIANPTGGGNVMTNPAVVYNGNLYIKYRNSTNKNQLAGFDGTTITLTPNLDPADDGFMDYATVYNNTLCFMYADKDYHYSLGRYDGNALTKVNNPGNSDAGFTGYPMLYNDNLYFQYSNSNGYYQVAQFDGTALSVIDNINPTDYGFSGYPIVYKNKLYFQYNQGEYPNSKNYLGYLSTSSAPELMASAQPAVICAGSTATLSVTATGNSTPFSYTWAAPPGIALSATATPAVSASAGIGVSGVQTFTVTVAGTDNVASTTTVSLTVNALTASVKANPPANLAVLGPGNCPVSVQTTITGTSAVFTGPGGYVFSSVYRRPGTYTVNVLNIKQPGTFTMTAATTNACGDRITDVVTFTITGTGCN